MNKTLSALRVEQHTLLKRFQSSKNLTLSNLIMKELRQVEEEIKKIEKECRHV